MPVTLTDQNPMAIAEKLADIKAVQKLIIDNEQQFLNQCSDNDRRRRLEAMLEDDHKNLDLVEVGVRPNPAS